MSCYFCTGCQQPTDWEATSYGTRRCIRCGRIEPEPQVVWDGVKVNWGKFEPVYIENNVGWCTTGEYEITIEDTGPTSPGDLPDSRDSDGKTWYDRGPML